MSLHRRRFLQMTSGMGIVALSGCSLFSSCDPACFEGEYQGADDVLDRITITHTGGEALPASEIYITGVADEYPPDPERGEDKTWAEVSDLTSSDSIKEGESVTVKIGYILKVIVYWRRGGEDNILAEFDAK